MTALKTIVLTHKCTSVFNKGMCVDMATEDMPVDVTSEYCTALYRHFQSFEENFNFRDDMNTP